MVTQTINPLSAQRDLSKTGLKTTSIYRVDQDLFYVPKPTLNSALILGVLIRFLEREASGVVTFSLNCPNCTPPPEFAYIRLYHDKMTKL